MRTNGQNPYDSLRKLGQRYSFCAAAYVRITSQRGYYYITKHIFFNIFRNNLHFVYKIPTVLNRQSACSCVKDLII